MLPLPWQYLLTPWCRVLLEKLTGLQLVKKFPAFYGTRRFGNPAFNVACTSCVIIILLHKLLKYCTVSRCVDCNQSTSLLIPFVWDVTPRCWVGGYRRFERTVRLYLQGFKVRGLRYVDFESLMMASCCFETSGTTYPVTQCHIPEDWNSLSYRYYELSKLACTWGIASRSARG